MGGELEIGAMRPAQPLPLRLALGLAELGQGLVGFRLILLSRAHRFVPS